MPTDLNIKWITHSSLRLTALVETWLKLQLFVMNPVKNHVRGCSTNLFSPVFINREKLARFKV